MFDLCAISGVGFGRDTLYILLVTCKSMYAQSARAGGISLAPLQLSLASRQQKREQAMENWSLDFLQGTDSVISPT